MLFSFISCAYLYVGKCVSVSVRACVSVCGVQCRLSLIFFQLFVSRFVWFVLKIDCRKQNGQRKKCPDHLVFGFCSLSLNLSFCLCLCLPVSHSQNCVYVFHSPNYFDPWHVNMDIASPLWPFLIAFAFKWISSQFFFIQFNFAFLNFYTLRFGVVFFLVVFRSQNVRRFFRERLLRFLCTIKFFLFIYLYRCTVCVISFLSASLCVEPN